MRFLADVGVSQRVLSHLAAKGHDVVHLRDRGLHRLADSGVYGLAISEKRVVLAFDLDFGEVAARNEGPWTSVVLFRLVNTTTPHVIERLDVALAVRP